MARALFGADTFTIVPYQLGDGNDEAIASGAWWFYYKLGFRPRDAATRRLHAAERGAHAARPGASQLAATLRRLASQTVSTSSGASGRDVLGQVAARQRRARTSRDISRALRIGPRRAPTRECADEAAARVGVRAVRLRRRRARGVASAGRRSCWCCRGSNAGARAERRALAEVIRAKGGRRESDFVRRFDAHPRLRAAIRDLAESNAPKS